MLRYFIVFVLTLSFINSQQETAEIIKSVLEKEGKNLTDIEQAIFTSWKEKVSFKKWVEAVDKKMNISEKLITPQNKYYYTFPDKDVAKALDVKVDKHVKTYKVFDDLAKNINELDWEDDFSYSVKEFSISAKEAKAFMELILLDDKTTVIKEAQKAIKKAKLIEELEAPLNAIVKDFQKEVAKRIKKIRKKNNEILKKLDEDEQPKKLWHLKFQLGDETYYALSEDVLSKELIAKILQEEE